LALHGAGELVNSGFTAEEKWSVFFPKVEQSAVRADGGADNI
jgi:hypothetical protein